jgi:hypothetical protein
MRKTDEVPVLVPLEDLYQPSGASIVSMLPADTEDYLQRTYGVTVHRDHRYRMAVTLEDAYKIRDMRQAEAERLHAEHLAKQRDDGTVNAWQRARARYWEMNYMSVLRAQPLGGGPEVERAGRARMALSRLVLDVEAAADIPADVQARLSWPAPSAYVHYPENSDRPEDYLYVPPEIEE